LPSMQTRKSLQAQESQLKEAKEVIEWYQYRAEAIDDEYGGFKIEFMELAGDGGKRGLAYLKKFKETK